MATITEVLIGDSPKGPKLIGGPFSMKAVVTKIDNASTANVGVGWAVKSGWVAVAGGILAMISKVPYTYQFAW